MNKICAAFIVLVLFSACSLNKLFLAPTRIAPDTKEFIRETDTEKLVVTFSPETHQPTFLKDGKDTIHYNFTVESVIFKSSNGNELNGWMLKPKGKIAKTTLLHFHGNAGFLVSQYKLMVPFVEQGFQVFLFDYSGFGFSEGKASRKNVLKDGHAALDYVKSREDVKNTKLVIYGQSLGGHLAAVVASERQNDIDALVIEGAFSSHKDVAEYKAAKFARIFVREQYSGVDSIRNYTKPLLVIHSTDDAVVGFEMGKKLFEAANAPKEFYQIQHRHIYGPLFYAEEIARKIDGMLGFPPLREE